MKFASNAIGEDGKEKKNEMRKSEGENTLRDVNDIKMKLRMRRSKANARERNRMHGLNKALDRLRR